MFAGEAYPALLLNADYRPLSYYPLSLLDWRDAIRSVMGDRVDLLDSYDREVRSPGMAMRLPRTLALRQFDPMDRPAALNRINIFLRDACPEGFRCVYCGGIFPRRRLTFDHIKPRAQGGITSFTNVASACEGCNFAKANRTPAEAGMVLLVEPWTPSMAELRERGRWFAERTLGDAWYWTLELEP